MTNSEHTPRPAQTLSDRVLIDVVHGRSQSTEPGEALRELVQRQPEPSTLLAEIVTDPQRPSDLRATAAVALGRRPTPVGERALLDALVDPDPAVVRRAAEALGRTAGPSALERLDVLRPPSGPAQRSVEFARILLSYRHGLERHRLHRPPQRSLLPVDPTLATEVTTTTLRPRTVEPILADAREEAAGIPLSAQGAQRFTCGDNTLAILLTLDLTALDSLDSLLGRSAVVGAVLERSMITGHYFLSEFLLADTAPQETELRLFGVRPGGTVVHVGELQTTGRFEVRTTDTRSSPPAAIDGSYDPNRKRLQIDRMLIHADFISTQRQPNEPRRLDDSGST